MFPLAGIGLGLGVLGTLGSLSSAMDGAQLRRRQAALEQQKTDEQVRRMQLDQASRVGSARAAGMASGVEADSSSLQAYLTTMSQEFRRQADWARESGYAGADAMRQEADLGERSALFGAAAGLGGSLFQFGAANNWWRKA